MSLSSVQNLARLRRTSGNTLLFALVLALSGCIQPLYGPGVGGNSVAAEMQAIKIDPIPERLGSLRRERTDFCAQWHGFLPDPKISTCRHIARATGYSCHQYSDRTGRSRRRQRRRGL